MAIQSLIETDFRVPILIAAWPGMGQVGLGAADYIRRKLHGKLVARVDVSSYYHPDEIMVSDGLGQVPSPPRQSLYHVVEPSVLVFVGEGQLAGESGLRLANELLDYAQSHGVGAVYTGAAYAMPISYRQPTEVYGVATDEKIRDEFGALGVIPLKEGRISGLNGLLLGIARTRGLPAACFLATMPQYAIETPNPRASRAVVQVFERILNTSVDLDEINQAVRDTDRLLEEFENRVSEAIRSLREQMTGGHSTTRRAEEAPDSQDERPEPHELMQHIEELFEQAQLDRSKALELKRELDRWGLFSLYEDRFLDLFGNRTS